jgi:hypothetical protein
MRNLTATLTGIAFIASFTAYAVGAQGATPQPSNSGSAYRALQNEISAAQDTAHPMQYRLRKSSPRLTTTRQMVETKDGQVALLLAINDAPPSAEDARKEKDRLNALLNDPGKQQHRKQSEDADTAHAMRILRALPKAFLYQDAGPQTTASGLTVERYTFTPDPRFNPPDLETNVLTQMVGEIWVDTVHQRVVHLEGRLENDVDFGWGVLGRLYKGGTVAIDQADVGNGVWRITRFQMKMSGRVLFKSRVFDTTEEETHFEPVSASLDYRQAIQMLREAQKGQISDSR